jgi:hypothetical protein
MVVTLSITKFKSLIFSMLGFALSYTAKMSILMILYDFCLLPAKCCYIIAYIRKVESRVPLENFPMARRTLFCRRYTMAAGPPYIVSALTAQRTSLPTAELCSHVSSLWLHASRVSFVNRTCNRTVKCHLYQHFREIVATGEERKHT